MPKSAYVIALALALTTLSGWATHAPLAHAQSHAAFVDPYLAAKVALGLGGGIDISNTANGVKTSVEQDPTVSFGVGAQYLYPLHEYFSVGGLLQFQSWRSTDRGGSGRNLVFDLAVLPQGKYVLLPGKLELNFGVPIGIAFDFWNELDITSVGFGPLAGAFSGGSIKGNNGLGFVVGALLGARFQLIEDLGLLLELGYLYRTVGHSIIGRANVGNFSQSVDVNVAWGQFQLNFGVYF